MERFIKVCEPTLGGASTCIYRYVNTKHIVSIQLNFSQYEVNVEATLTNNTRVIILKREDIVDLVGNEVLKEWEEEIVEKTRDENE